MSISWPSFVIGLLVGFFLRETMLIIFKQNKSNSDQMLAWVISVTWVVWHIAAGLNLVDGPPPTMYDLVSGGTIGWILGDKFWDSAGSFFKRK